MGPKTVKVLVHEKNKDILGLNYETIKKAHEQMIANQQEKKKGAASKDGKVKLPKHYEPKGLIWSVNDFISEAQSNSRSQIRPTSSGKKSFKARALQEAHNEDKR